MANPDGERSKQYIEIWAKAVDTQMHFNQMSVKSRQLGLTFVAAALGLSVVLLSRKEDFSFTLGKVELHVSVVLLLTAMGALWAVKQLDLNVYHRMLRGAVTFGEDFEENHLRHIFQLNKGMTQAISHFSRYDDAGTTIGPDGKYVYIGRTKLSAELKIRRFYNYTSVSLVVAAIALFIVTNIEHRAGPSPPPARAAEGTPPTTILPATKIAESVQRNPATAESKSQSQPKDDTTASREKPSK